MKSSLSTLAALAVAFGLRADPVVSTLRSDGTTNTWTQADLADALGLMNRKYWRDMKTESGRVAWHGTRISTVEDMTNLTQTVTYEDGYVHVEPFRRLRPLTFAERAALAEKRKAAAAAARLAAQPPALRAVEEAREAAASVTNTVTVHYGANP